MVGLHWDTVKNIEKDWRAKKYKDVSLKDVRYLSIDEVYLGKKFGYITVVRDLISGSVLYVGKGKGGEYLQQVKRNQRNLFKHIQNAFAKTKPR